MGGTGGDRNLTRRPTGTTNPDPGGLTEAETTKEQDSLDLGHLSTCSQWWLGLSMGHLASEEVGLLLTWTLLPAFGSLPPGRAAWPGLRG